MSQQFMNEDQAVQLLNAAIIEGDDAFDRYRLAADALDAAKRCMYEEYETDDGDFRNKPLDAVIKEIEDNANTESILPNGKSTKDERANAVKAYLLRTNAEYREKTEVLADAEFSVSLAKGHLDVAERIASRANAKFGAVKAMLEFLTAKQQYQTAQITVNSK